MIEDCNLKVFSSHFSTRSNNVGATRTFLRGTSESGVVGLMAPAAKRFNGTVAPQNLLFCG